MSSTEIEITDPARELSTLGRHFLDSKGGGSTTEGLSRSLGIGVDDPEFLEVLAAIQRRVRDLEKLASTVAEADLAPELKRDVVAAARAFTNLLHPKHASSPWEQTRSKFLPEKNVTALKFFSQTARRYRPLRKVPDEKQKEVLSKIIEAIESVLSDDELEDWIKPPLLDGLEHIRLVLKHLQFFGHEAAIADLFLVHQRFSAAAEMMAEAKPATQSGNIWKALNVLGVAGSIFVLPHEGANALSTYIDWTGNFLKVITSPHIPPDQRLLPPPVATKVGDDEEQIDDGSEKQV